MNISQCLKDGDMMLDRVNVCVTNDTTAYFFLPFLLLPVLKRTQRRAISKLIIDIFLQILDGNWIDDAYGRVMYRYSQKCIAIQYLFRVNRDLPIYRYIVAPLM